jgi:hypothetical protein
MLVTVEFLDAVFEARDALLSASATTARRCDAGRRLQIEIDKLHRQGVEFRSQACEQLPDGRIRVIDGTA